jgi:RsiW-degrading membrane proteinase PrsW (M82 family)
MILILAIAPLLLIAYYIYKKDKYDVEPRKLIIQSFLFGCLGIACYIFRALRKRDIY